MKSVILLSGGLDSLVVLGVYKEKYGIELALTFDYGQKAVKQEIEASINICKYYGINHKVLKLDWLREITNTSLVAESEVPKENLGTFNSAKNVWVPNRNSLFINIAASYADSYMYDYILYGANKDEGKTFPDNTEEFRQRISDLLQYSTLSKTKVIAPLIKCTKDDIVRMALEKKIPLQYVRSCYNSDSNLHCGECESCTHLKRALVHNNAKEFIKILFGK